LRNKIRVGLTLAVGIVLLGAALYGVDFGELRSNIAGADLGLLALGGALYLSAYFVRSLRWRAILQPIARVRVSESFFMLMAGYFLNYVIPIRAGEVAKSFFLKRLRGVPIATSLPTIFFDKLLELMSILLVVILVPVLSISMSATLAALIYTVLAIFVASMALLLYAFRNPDGASRLLSSLFSWLPDRIHRRLSDFAGLFVKGMGVARREVRTLGALLGLTGLAVFLDALYFFTMFRAFSVDVGFVRVLFGYTLLTLSYILPTPPAQIGYNEFVIGLIFAGGLAASSVPRDEVMAVIIVAHAMTGLIIAGTGVWSFGAMGIRMGESFKRVTGSGAMDDAGPDTNGAEGTA
jgi:uncharacterized protein (TIRG00374 family)